MDVDTRLLTQTCSVRWLLGSGGIWVENGGGYSALTTIVKVVTLVFNMENDGSIITKYQVLNTIEIHLPKCYLLVWFIGLISSFR